MDITPEKLVIKLKYRELQDWKECKSETLNHTLHDIKNMLLRQLKEIPIEEEFVVIYPSGSGTSAWSGDRISMPTLEARI